MAGQIIKMINREVADGLRRGEPEIDGHMSAPGLFQRQPGSISVTKSSERRCIFAAPAKGMRIRTENARGEPGPAFAARF